MVPVCSKVVRKSIARVLTVVNQTTRSKLREEVAGKVRGDREGLTRALFCRVWVRVIKYSEVLVGRSGRGCRQGAWVTWVITTVRSL